MNYAIITGTSRGLGKALAYVFSKNDFKVFLIARKGLRKIVKDLNKKNNIAKAVFFDLTNLYNIDELLDKIFKEIDFPNLSKIVLINNAATISPTCFVGDIQETKQIAYNLNINCLAPIILTNAFIKKTKPLPADKIIINISSGAAFRSIEGWSLYCSSKASIEMFSKCVSKEQKLIKSNVKIYSFDPGALDTEMQKEIRSASSKVFPHVEQFIELYERKSLKNPFDVANEIYNLFIVNTMRIDNHDCRRES